jgi:hypothetical protein
MYFILTFVKAKRIYNQHSIAEKLRPGPNDAEAFGVQLRAITVNVVALARGVICQNLQVELPQRRLSVQYIGLSWELGCADIAKTWGVSARRALFHLSTL